MGRMVIAPIDSETVTSDATQDLWSLMAPATNKLILHGWEITSNAIAATLLECTLRRITAHGSGGNTTVTEEMLDTDNGTIVGSVNLRNTTPGTTGNVLAGYQWEQLGPLGMIYTPEMRPVIEVSTGIALVCNTAAAFEMSGWICWEEI
jgi:hypothetical protein